MSGRPAKLRLVKEPDRERLTSLRLSEFSDRELLQLIVDLRDAAGVVTSQQIAEALDPDTDQPVSCVGVRLGWMRRYGAVEHAPEQNGPGWVLTSVGERIARLGHLKAGQERMLGELEPEQGLDAALALGRLYKRVGVTESIMLRRGWQHASGRRQ